MSPALRPTLAVLLVLTLGTACTGSDGKDHGAAPRRAPVGTVSTTTTIRTLAPNEVDATASPFCAVWANIRELGAAPLTGDPKLDTEARKVHYARLLPLAEQLLAVAAVDVERDVRYVLAQVREVAETGSEEPFHDAAASTTQQELAKYALDHCAKQ